jgi:hypothetical protein
MADCKDRPVSVRSVSRALGQVSNKLSHPAKNPDNKKGQLLKAAPGNIINQAFIFLPLYLSADKQAFYFLL